MVDATKACESAYVDVNLVQNSKAKRVVILNGGAYVEGKFGEKLEIGVEMDGKQKTWSPNRDCATSLKLAYGEDTNRWVGKVVSLELMMKNGKLAIVALPTHGPKVDAINPNEPVPNDVGNYYPKEPKVKVEEVG